MRVDRASVPPGELLARIPRATPDNLLINQAWVSNSTIQISNYQALLILVDVLTPHTSLILEVLLLPRSMWVMVVRAMTAQSTVAEVEVEAMYPTDIKIGFIGGDVRGVNNGSYEWAQGKYRGGCR